MLVGGLALALRWTSYGQALALAAGLIIFNAFVLPRLPWISALLYRPGEREHWVSSGILLYPVSVFILIFLFPVPVVAAMWGLLSCGDGMATLVGRRIGRVRLPWSRRKTLEGLLAFVLVGSISASALCWWSLPNVTSSPPWWRGEEAARFDSLDAGGIILWCVLSSVASALVETLELPVDDNLTVPLGGACVMVGLAYALT
ncbi:MAG: hypothetical protein Kow0099_14690 [Candidatus Abyssubacteria bacterium]